MFVRNRKETTFHLGFLGSPLVLRSPQCAFGFSCEVSGLCCDPHEMSSRGFAARCPAFWAFGRYSQDARREKASGTQCTPWTFALDSIYQLWQLTCGFVEALSHRQLPAERKLELESNWPRQWQFSLFQYKFQFRCESRLVPHVPYSSRFPAPLYHAKSACRPSEYMLLTSKSLLYFSWLLLIRLDGLGIYPAILVGLQME